MDKETRTSYKRILNDPDDWVHTAALLRRVAEEINTFRLSSRGLSNLKQNELEIVSLMQVGRFLMGLSFENLLKAIIIAHGKSPLFKHDINRLIEQIDSSRLNLTDEEKGILIELEEYVLWEGRYPIPKNAGKHKIVHVYSSE